jgi:hypothetical protein
LLDVLNKIEQREDLQVLRGTVSKAFRKAVFEKKKKKRVCHGGEEQ